MIRGQQANFIMLLVLATFFMGSSFPTGKYLITVAQIPPFFLGGFRFMIAGLVLLILCRIFLGSNSVIPSKNNSKAIGLLCSAIVGLLQTTLAMGFLNLAFQRIDSALASVLFFTNPLWVLIFAHYARLERLTLLKLIGLLYGIVGVILCLNIGNNANYLGVIFALLGAVSWALCTIAVRSFCKIEGSPLSIAGWQMLLGGFGLLVLSTIFSELMSLNSLNGLGVFNLLWLIFPASVGSFGLWFLALQKGGMAQASSFLFLAPMFATLFAILFLNEALTIKFICGCICIFLAIYLVNHKSLKS